MKKPEPVPLTREERESQAAVDALAAHQATEGDMIAEYTLHDDAAVELAKKFAPENAAGSPKAWHTWDELNILKRKRDGLKYSWDRKRQLLIHEIEKFSMPILTAFHEETFRRVRWLYGQRTLDFVTNLHSRDGLQIRNRARSNFAVIKAETDKLLQDLNEVKALHIRPLHEINTRIEEADMEWRGADKRIKKTDEIVMTESDFLGVQESINRPEDQPGNISRLPGFFPKHMN
jgi:hypothetical protein